MKVLLDTHVLLWWLNDRTRLSAAQRDIVNAADSKSPLLVSDISLWEIAMLHSLERISLLIPLREWLDKATAPPLVQRHGISPAIAAEVAGLPASFHKDPADRILVATARVLGVTLLTQDRRIIDAALVNTIN